MEGGWTNERPGNLSSDLRANKRHPMAQTDRQTRRHTDGHCDSMTESAHLADSVIESLKPRWQYQAKTNNYFKSKTLSKVVHALLLKLQ